MKFEVSRAFLLSMSSFPSRVQFDEVTQLANQRDSTDLPLAMGAHRMGLQSWLSSTSVSCPATLLEYAESRGHVPM